MDTTHFGSGKNGQSVSWQVWFISVGTLLVIVLAMILPTSNNNSSARQAFRTDASQSDLRSLERIGASGRVHMGGVTSAPEQIVSGKVTQFANSRLKITQAMAKRFKVSFSAEVQAFFDAATAGKWEELNARFSSLKKRRESGENAEDLNVLWGPILETLLIAECAHEWPAQKLLDYGDKVLGTLRPGMVYVGGTDPGRGIPTLLNETGDGERHIVLTQNALADNTYLQYVNFLYGDQMATLTPEESQHAFDEYIADAQKRFDHDQQFPEEPKQLQPGENVSLSDNRVQVSGQIAVMGINEKLLQAIMNKNQNLSFALEESFPLKSTYADAAPLGPIMELRVQNQESSFNQDTAAQASDYWKSLAQQFASDTEEPPDSLARKTYSKMAAAQANLLADHNYGADAEQAYRSAVEICPSSPEAVFGYINLLVQQSRFNEAIPIAERAVQAAPDYQQFEAVLNQLKKLSYP